MTLIRARGMSTVTGALERLIFSNDHPAELTFSGGRRAHQRHLWIVLVERRGR